MFGYKAKPGDHRKATIGAYSPRLNQVIPPGMISDEDEDAINKHHDELSAEYEGFHKAAMGRTQEWYHDVQAQVIQDIQDDPRIGQYALWQKDNPFGTETFNRQTS